MISKLICEPGHLPLHLPHALRNYRVPEAVSQYRHWLDDDFVDPTRSVRGHMCVLSF